MKYSVWCLYAVFIILLVQHLLANTPETRRCHSCASYNYVSVWDQLIPAYYPPKNYTDQCWNPGFDMGSVGCSTACFTLVEDIAQNWFPLTEEPRLSGMVAPLAAKPPLHTSLLIYVALQTSFISILLSYYGFELGPVVRPPLLWAAERLGENSYLSRFFEAAGNILVHEKSETTEKARPHKLGRKKTAIVSGSKLDVLKADVHLLPVFTNDQLALFDGSRPSKGVYLCLLGRVYNVERGRKHYAPGGGYHFFAGKDATRAFVTGDFSETGLTDEVTGLSHQDLLGILDWINFYETGYELIGLLRGTYYDKDGRPTQRFKDVVGLMEDALRWKDSQAKESEIFPPCNSEWHSNVGGRVWCSAKSGGIHREWIGVPRRLFSPGSKTFRCACVKDFGSPLSSYPGADQKGSRGDLDNPSLREYPDCKPTSNSCKIQKE